MLLTGLFCGLLGIALMCGMSVAEALIRRGVPGQTMLPAAGGLLVGALAIVTPGVLSRGHGVLLTDLPVRFLLILILLKAFASAIFIGSVFSGGLFFASILLGAIVGTLLAAVTVATSSGVTSQRLLHRVRLWKADRPLS